MTPEEIELTIIKAELSLYEFLKQAWPIIEGKTPFIDNWHLKVVAEHLEACYRREIKNLLINVPPRTSKTSLISIAFPAWVWLQNSEERFMYLDFGQNYSQEPLSLFKKTVFQSSIIKF